MQKALKRLRASVAVYALAATFTCLSATAAAQDHTETDAESGAAPATSETADDDAITVTGSRTVRDGFAAPTPVMVTSSEELLDASPTNLADGLNRLPQLTGSTAPNRGSHLRPSEPSGGYFLNLRGLGSIRTLVLLDEVRLPPTEFLGLVDANIVPNQLIKRVDIVTAGASAVYGSDAISGVINFVLDKDFTGVKGTLQRGVSSRGDNGNYRAAIAFGTPIGDRTHLLLSAERFDSDGYLKSDRPKLFDLGLAVGRTPGGVPGSADNPLVFQTNVRQGSQTFGGLATSGPFSGEHFLSLGVHRPIELGIPTGTSDRYIGGDGYFVPGYTSAATAVRNDVLFGRVSHDFGNDVTAYVQGSYSNTRVGYAVLPASLTGLRINSGNPFLPADLQQRLTDAGAPSFTLAKFFAELGPAVTREETEAYIVQAGLNGHLGALRWSVDYIHGTSNRRAEQSNILENTKLAAALDAVADGAGQVVCRASLDPRADVRSRYGDCVPFNPFGFESSSAAARDYVTGTSIYRARNATDSFSAGLSGELFSLGAGPVSFAVGGEYREQELSLTSNADPAIPIDITGLETTGISPATTRFFLNNVGSANGHLNVKEAYAELTVPLLADIPFIRSLDLNGAARYADYSTSGSAVTWKLGATWEPVDSLRFRVSRSRDFRAPTLYDLFAGQQANNAQIFDPHTNSGGSGTIFITSGGNPNLKPEIGNTFTAGVVWSPDFIPGLALSVDYYDIKISNAIGTLTPAQIVQDCEDSGGTAPTCALVTRPLPYSDRSPANYPTAIRVVGANIASVEVRGIDFDARYSVPLGNGRLGMRLFANYTDRFATQRSLSQPVVDYAGYLGAPVSPIPSGTGGVAVPRWKGTASLSYENGGFGLFIQEQMVGTVKYSPLPSQIYADPKIGSVFYTDLTVSYKVPAYRDGLELFLTVNNLFDRDPPLVYGTTTPGRDLSTETSLYDTNGRQFTAGVRFQF